jgi:hypothetical protein
MRAGIGILAFGGTAYYPVQDGWSEWSDALNTATMAATDADGNPLTGASGHVYSELSLPVYTTTTSSSSTTSTLPAPPATCGNGTLDAGEACECPPTDDPVRQGAGCRGSNATPVQEDCVVCRLCQVVRTLCPMPSSITTTTTGTTTTSPGATTTIAGATTTTATAPGATTTTTLPAACAGLAGIPRAACLLETDLGAPLCGIDPLPRKVDARLRGKLGSAEKLLSNAGTRTAKKLASLVKRSRHLLGAADAQAHKASTAHNPKRHISAGCAATIESLISSVTATLPSS